MSETTLLHYTSQESLATSHHALPFMRFNSINPLVAAATPLLLLMISLKQTQYVDQEQIFALRHQVINEVLAFVETANKLRCSPRLVLAARYCLCTALDEKVLSTLWGNNSTWSHQTLLSIIQKETWGGERFFIILEEMAKSPEENLHLLELLYIILSLGFEGRYYQQEQAMRDEIRHRLFHLIMMHREEPERSLSPSLSVLRDAVLPVRKTLSKSKIFKLAALLFVAIIFFFNVITWLQSKEILQAIVGINQQIDNSVISAAATIINTPPPLHNSLSKREK